MFLIYPAKFIKTSNGYTVSFPDFGTEDIYGSDLEEAYCRSETLLADLVSRQYLKGEPLPAPSAVSADGNNEICFFSLIGIDSDGGERKPAYFRQEEDVHGAGRPFE